MLFWDPVGLQWSGHRKCSRFHALRMWFIVGLMLFCTILAPLRLGHVMFLGVKSLKILGKTPTESVRRPLLKSSFMPHQHGHFCGRGVDFWAKPCEVCLGESIHFPCTVCLPTWSVATNISLWTQDGAPKIAFSCLISGLTIVYGRYHYP